MPKAIANRWTCHDCLRGNEAGISACAHCGAPAPAGIERIERAAPQAYGDDSSATPPPVQPRWPWVVRFLDGATVVWAVIAFEEFDPFYWFDAWFLLSVALAAVFGAAAMLARRIVKGAPALPSGGIP